MILAGLTKMKKITIKAQDEEGNAVRLTLSLQKDVVEAPKKTKEITLIDGKNCPECGKRNWDNRTRIKDGSFSSKSPHFACSDKQGCKWAVWAGQYKLEEEAGDDLIEEAKELFESKDE